MARHHSATRETGLRARAPYIATTAAQRIGRITQAQLANAPASQQPEPWAPTIGLNIPATSVTWWGHLFVVQHDLENGEWLDCVREDLLGPFDDDGRNLPKAIFTSEADAETFIAAMQGIVHCGADRQHFRIVPGRFIPEEQSCR